MSSVPLGRACVVWRQWFAGFGIGGVLASPECRMMGLRASDFGVEACCAWATPKNH